MGPIGSVAIGFGDSGVVRRTTYSTRRISLPKSKLSLHKVHLTITSRYSTLFWGMYVTDQSVSG